jgi:hypothetical protein
VPPPPGSGGRGTLAGERGVGREPIPTMGHTLWYSLYIRTLWALLLLAHVGYYLPMVISTCFRDGNGRGREEAEVGIDICK